MDKSLRNQARFIAIDEKRVEQYAEAMKRGDEFPPVIAHGKLGKLIMADGNRVRSGPLSADKDGMTSQRGEPDGLTTPAATATPDNSGYQGTAVVAGNPSTDGDREPWELADRITALFLLGYKGCTARAYASDIKDFKAYARTVGTPPLQFSRAALELYVKHLTTGRGLAPSSVGRRLAALSGWFSYAEAEEAIAKSPMTHVRRPRVPRESPVHGLEREVLRLILQAAEQHSPRAHALISVLVLNGLRLGEVLAADASDLGVTRGIPTLTITRKGGRVAVVPLTPVAVDAVLRYLDGRTAGPLIVSKSGRRLDQGSANNVIRAVAALVLPPEEAAGIHAHRFRHGAVAGMLDAGVPLHEVQQAAGHASADVTVLYDRARTEISKAHPVFALAAWLEDAPSTPVLDPHMPVPGEGLDAVLQGGVERDAAAQVALEDLQRVVHDGAVDGGAVGLLRHRRQQGREE